MLVQHVADLPADAARRIERGARVLEHDADLAPAEIRPGVGAPAGEVDAAEFEALGVKPRRRRQDAGDGVGEQRLARAAFADQRDDLAARNGKADRVDRRRPGVVAEGDIEALDGEQRLDGEGGVHARRGSSQSRSASPMSEKVRMAASRKAPGKLNSHHSPEMM